MSLVNIGERIKKLRTAKGLTQQEFANRLGVSRSNIATYEVGKNNPADAVIKLICREFSANETWLRTGEGEMFVELPENEELAARIRAFLQGGSDSFREKLISLLLRLPPEHWEILKNYALELVGGSAAVPAPAEADTRPRSEKPVTEWTEEEINEEAEEYRRSLLEEKKRAESGPASGGPSSSGTA